jgi:hydroxymethylpyrimidine pyrophosphatase-like HAD family hydrolase
MNKGIKIAWDVDGTLIWDGQPPYEDHADTPRYSVIRLYLMLESLGCEMYIWSGGGVDYARRWAEKLGLRQAIIVAKGSFVPDIAYDDEYVKLGKINIKV